MKLYLTAPVVALMLNGLAGTVSAKDSPAAPASHAEAPSVSPDAALAKLIAGNNRYASNSVSAGKATAKARAATAQSQHPFAIVVGCADSRTSPEIVFDQNLGDLFVIRTAGNLVDDYALGSIEYAVAHLGAKLIVVLGHERCGAVKAAVASGSAPGHVGNIVSDIRPAVKAVQGGAGDLLENSINENVYRVADKIAHKAKLGEAASSVRIVRAVYDLDNGKVNWLK
ncbi:MAG: carbonic anhydrase [Verrucomicrobiota bacterium]